MMYCRALHGLPLRALTQQARRERSQVIDTFQPRPAATPPQEFETSNHHHILRRHQQVMCDTGKDTERLDNGCECDQRTPEPQA